MKVIFPHASRTHVGCVRKHNEDFYLSRPDLGLWVVCDGIGGHHGGEIASRYTAETVVAEVEQGAGLVQAILNADAGLKKQADPGQKKPPGSTVLALQIRDGNYELAWVGDSRAWLWDGVTLAQISTDHSYVQRLVNWGEITEEEAAHHPDRHRLSQAVGLGDAPIKPDVVSGIFKPDEQALILATDGLYGFNRNEVMTGCLRECTDPEQCTSFFERISIENDAGDNLTMTVVGWPAKTGTLWHKIMGFLKG